MCFEALKPGLAVQSYMQAFTGLNSNGYMPLRQSNAEHRVLFQLHPRESLFIGSKTISVMPGQATEDRAESSQSDTHAATMFPPHDSEIIQGVPETPGVAQADRTRSVRSVELSLHDFGDYSETIVASVPESADSQSSRLSNDDTANPESFQSQIEGVSSLDNQMPDLDEFINAVTRSPQSEARICNDHPMNVRDGKRRRESSESPGVGQSGSSEERVELSMGDTAFINASTFSFEPSNASGCQQGSLRAQDGLKTRPENHLAMSNDESCNQETARIKRRKLEARLGHAPFDEGGEETPDSMMSSIAVQVTDTVATKVDQDEREIGEEDETALTTGMPVIVEEEVQSSAASSTQKLDSSMRSTRSTTKKPKARASQAHSGLRVLFASSTSIDSSKHLMRFLESKGVKRVSSVNECTHLCISKSGGLKKTSKFVTAVLLGRQVLWYDWVIESVKAKAILNPDHFAARGPDIEAEWGVNLNEAIERGRGNGQGPFSGWSIVFTPAAKHQVGKSGYSELARIVSIAGGKRCSTALPKGTPRDDDLTLIVAIQEDPALKKLKGSWRCFSRDIIALSAMRGRLDTSSDEFLITDELPPGP